MVNPKWPSVCWSLAGEKMEGTHRYRLVPNDNQLLLVGSRLLRAGYEEQNKLASGYK